MPWNAEVPPLGFEGEPYEDTRHRVMHNSHHLGVIEIYAWSELEEGYNIFLPGQGPVSAASPLEVQFIVHAFLNKGDNDAHEL
jgi:hypothetical protein